jgi:hypothetical protein
VREGPPVHDVVVAVGETVPAAGAAPFDAVGRATAANATHASKASFLMYVPFGELGDVKSARKYSRGFSFRNTQTFAQLTDESVAVFD